MTRSHSCPCARKHGCSRRPCPRLQDKGVDQKRRPPKSRPAPSRRDNRALKPNPPWQWRPAGTPPSTFLFLPIHLSNSPDREGPAPQFGNGEPSKPGHPTGVGSLVTDISDGASKTRRRAEAAACRNDRLYRLRLPSKSTPVAGEIWRARCSRVVIVASRTRRARAASR